MLPKHALSITTFSILAAACGGLRDEMPRAEEDTAPTEPGAGPSEQVGQEVPREGVVSTGPPNAGAIGIAGRHAYWQFRAETGSGIASGALDGRDASIIVAPIDDLHVFDVAARVVYQTSGGSVFAIQPGASTPTELRASGEPCSAVTSDEDTIYCLTGSTVLGWKAPIGEPTMLYAGAPEGASIAVDDHHLYIATRSAGTVVRAPKEGGGVFLGEAVTERRSGVSKLAVGKSDLVWSESGEAKDHDEVWWAPLGTITATKIAGGTRIHAIDGRFVFLGPSDGGAQIDRLDLATDTRTKVPGSETVGLGGIAVHDGFVYWTARDGRVSRTRI
jgi:hypothetical protein